MLLPYCKGDVCNFLYLCLLTILWFKMKEKTIYLLIFLLLVSTSGFSQGSTSVDSLKKHVFYLASPELKGRQAGTEGDSLAAVYIKEKFMNAGLEPLFKNSFQYFTLVTEVSAGELNKFVVVGKEYEAGKDFQPFSFSTSDSLEAQVVFAGFGIEGKSDSLLWDDYKMLDIKSKWVLLIRGDPEPDNPSSAFIPMASDRAKALNAKDRGAAGVLLVSPSSIDRADQPVDIAFDKSVSDAGLPVISITRRLAADILNLQVKSIDSLEKQMISTKKSISFYAPTTVKAITQIQREKAVSRNIGAMIQGSDPDLKDEYIVIGAHYDHLGMGGSGSGSRVPDESAVHGGADDNASGVASLIELARYFSIPSNRLSRSIIFASFGAEEMGIIGARYFIDHSPVPVNSIKAMINLDMIGRLKDESEPSISISGTGTSNITDSILNIVEKNRIFSIKRVPDGYGPSDHAAFYTAGIPVLFLSTGVHTDYHTPLDSPEKLNYVGQTAITDFTADLVSTFGNLKEAPIFAEAGAKREAGHYGRNLKVTLGIMPDVSGAETSGGMKVEGTRKDAPAAKAGMMKGDIITAINGMKVANIYDYMSRLSKLKPGDTVNVEILRNGAQEILIIQL